LLLCSAHHNGKHFSRLAVYDYTAIKTPQQFDFRENIIETYAALTFEFLHVVGDTYQQYKYRNETNAKTHKHHGVCLPASKHSNGPPYNNNCALIRSIIDIAHRDSSDRRQAVAVSAEYRSRTD
jgi:hypothetical protein